MNVHCLPTMNEVLGFFFACIAAFIGGSMYAGVVFDADIQYGAKIKNAFMMSIIGGAIIYWAMGTAYDSCKAGS